jgi:hypothetical protein
VSQDPKLIEARDAVFRAAIAVSANNRGLAQRVTEGAEMSVMRKILCDALLPGGEIEYWKRVEEELRR